MATTLLATAVKSAAGLDSTVSRAVRALPQLRTNVSSQERWLAMGAGATLVGLGLTGRTPFFLSSMIGAGLILRAATGNCAVYQAAGASTSDSTAENTAIAAGHGTRVEHAITVSETRAELYRFWRDFENLPRFMTHLVKVEVTANGRFHWVAEGPLGLKMEWDAEIVSDVAGEVISWRSLDGADVDTAGSVHFSELPNGRGTEVRVELKYDPPAGKLGTAIAKLVGHSPAAQIKADMRRFKQIIEAGEVPTSRGQSHGTR